MRVLGTEVMGDETVPQAAHIRERDSRGWEGERGWGGGSRWCAASVRGPVLRSGLPGCSGQAWTTALSDELMDAALLLLTGWIIRT